MATFLAVYDRACGYKMTFSILSWRDNFDALNVMMSTVALPKCEFKS